MGGCRCTYRNCSSRTDGKTHMFHYPVFDKVRCHQWLTNAHKLEFLNLKVSQLKNRVVCQHHFKDENFMNFKKDKLTFDAVPTEDGPYCDSSQLNVKKTVQDESKAFNISLEDIEYEYLSIVDKKANFSVKYGDFLTNCDLMDLDALNHINDDNQIALHGLVPLDPGPKDLPSGPAKSIIHTSKGKSIASSSNTILNDHCNRENTIILDNLSIDETTKDINKKSEIQLKEDQNSINLLLNISHVPIEFDEKKQNCHNQPYPDQSLDVKVFDEINPSNENPDRSLLKKKKGIRIISEKKISEPVGPEIFGKLESVSPNKVLLFPNKRRIINSNPVKQIPEVKTNSVQENTVEVTEQNINNFVNHKSEPCKIINLNRNDVTPPQSRSHIKNKGPNEVFANTSLIKNKIPPERVAAIAEKRKFNMKLRDIIEDCLDKLDEPDKSDYNVRKQSGKSRVMQSKKQQVGSYLAKEPNLPNVKDYTIAYLEARMKKMENNLLSKIDENSQKIVELKQKLLPICEKKSVHTQTSASEDLHKRQLYKGLSKYLSPEANSLIYEELFINKYTQQVPKSLSAKRRKCRR